MKAGKTLSFSTDTLYRYACKKHITNALYNIFDKHCHFKPYID